MKRITTLLSLILLSGLPGVSMLHAMENSFLSDVKDGALIIGATSLVGATLFAADLKVEEQLSPEHMRCCLAKKTLTNSWLGTLAQKYQSPILLGLKNGGYHGALLGVMAAIECGVGKDSKIRIQELGIPLSLLTSMVAIGWAGGYLMSGITATPANVAAYIEERRAELGNAFIPEQEEKQKAMYRADSIDKSVGVTLAIGSAAALLWIAGNRPLGNIVSS